MNQALDHILRSLILLAITLSLTGWLTVAQARSETLPALSLYDAVLDSQVDRIYEDTEGRISTYRVVAMLTQSDSGTFVIDGKLDLDFYNLTGDAIDHLPVRLYPNYPPYQEGELTIDSAFIDGEPVSPVLSLDDTLATFPLPHRLAADQFLHIEIAFTTIVPIDPPDTYGMFEYDTLGSTLSMAHWQPLVNGWDREFGWNDLPVDTRGDPVFTTAALFDVTLTAPSSLQFATSGSEVSASSTANETIHRWTTGPSRDFVMIASPSFEMASLDIAGTTINSYFAGDDREAGLEVLDTAANALEIYGELIGPYPYKELDVVEARLGSRAAGIEFPGLVFVGANLYEPGLQYLEFTTAHEVGHQWWYNVVGNNQYQHAFLDESLTNYLATVYFEKRYGEDVGNQAVNDYLKASYFGALFGDSGDEIVDKPTADFKSDRSYGRIVYGKGPLGFQAIRAEIGDDAFFEGLSQYARAFDFKIAIPTDLQSALEVSSGKDLGKLWDHWFLSANGAQDFGPDDLQEILQQ